MEICLSPVQNILVFLHIRFDNSVTSFSLEKADHHPSIALSQTHTASVLLFDHEGPSPWPCLITQHPCLWPQSPSGLHPTLPAPLHCFLMDSVTVRVPHLHARQPDLMGFLLLCPSPVSKGFAGALGVLCSHPAHPAQLRHVANTSSPLAADLVSEKNWD